MCLFNYSLLSVETHRLEELEKKKKQLCTLDSVTSSAAMSFILPREEVQQLQPDFKVDLKLKLSKAVSRLPSNENDDNQFVNIYVTYIYHPQTNYFNSIIRSTDKLPQMLDDIVNKFQVAVDSLKKAGIDFPVSVLDDIMKNNIAQG